MHVEGMTLEALSRAVGALHAGAVCRIGHRIAESLTAQVDGALDATRVVVDDNGDVRVKSLTSTQIAAASRLWSPERRATGGAPSVADDLWALGVIVADAALGKPCEPMPESGGIFVPDGLLQDRLVDAIAVLVAPAEARLRNPAAAARMFGELSFAFGDAEHILRKALAEARKSRAPIAPTTIVTRNADHPRTVQMSAEDTLGLAELKRVAALAQQASTRTEETRERSDPRGQAPPPRAPSLDAPSLPLPRDTVRLPDEEVLGKSPLARAGPFIAIGCALLALLTVAFLAGKYLG